MPAPPAPPTDTVVDLHAAAYRADVATAFAAKAHDYFDSHPELDRATYAWSVQFRRDPGTATVLYQMRGVRPGHPDLLWALATHDAAFY